MSLFLTDYVSGICNVIVYLYSAPSRYQLRGALCTSLNDDKQAWNVADKQSLMVEDDALPVGRQISKSSPHTKGIRHVSIDCRV